MEYNIALLPHVGDIAALWDPISVIANHDLMDVLLCSLAKKSYLFDACFHTYVEECQKQAETKGCPKLAFSEYGPSSTTKPTNSQIADLDLKMLDLCSRLTFACSGASNNSCSSKADNILMNNQLREYASFPSFYSK